MDDRGDPVPVVLVVDDEDWMRDACGTILAKEGVEVLTASNARAGLDIATARRPDLVLIDVRMPGANGIDFLEGLKAIDPDVVGIVISGYATIDVAVRAIKAGAEDFLPKPFEPEQLRSIVRRGLEHRQLLRRTAVLGPEVPCMKGVHMAVLAHQLKSPLVSLRQCVSVVLQGYVGELPDKARGMIEVIEKRADQMLCLLDDWITLVRLEEGGAVARREPVELDALLEKLVQTAIQGPEVSALSLRFQRSAGGAVILGDPVSLSELFANLVTNAIRYTQAGGGIRIAAEAGPTEVVIRVSDNGPGIPEDEQERVFEPFFRGKAQRAIAGDGLGLPIARRIARAHGGDLTVKSAPGQGSEFRAAFPVGGGPSPPAEPGV